MNHGQFPLLLHLLVLLHRSKGTYLSSSYLAGSVRIHPVLVRNALILLKEKNWIITKEGKGGGATLADLHEEIYLSEIYDLVKSSALLGQQKNQPNPLCAVGKQINQHMDVLYESAELVLKNHLSNYTLAGFSAQFTDH